MKKERRRINPWVYVIQTFGAAVIMALLGGAVNMVFDVIKLKEDVALLMQRQESRLHIERRQRE
jgi:hypothetical protein